MFNCARVLQSGLREQPKFHGGAKAPASGLRIDLIIRRAERQRFAAFHASLKISHLSLRRISTCWIGGANADGELRARNFAGCLKYSRL